GDTVERPREAALSGGQVGAVEGVRLLGGGDPGVLPDGPRLLGVHRGPRSAQEGEVSGDRVEEVEPLDVGPRVERLEGDPLGRVPDQLVRGGALALLPREGVPAAPGRPPRRGGPDWATEPCGSRVQRPPAQIRTAAVGARAPRWGTRDG